METIDNYVSKVQFADIVDDCMWYTFEHLSLKEKVGVMRVNKRWRKVATHLIENESCLKLKLMKKDKSEVVANYRKYTDEESVNQNLISIFGKNAVSLFNYKLEFVEQVRIIGIRGPSKNSSFRFRCNFQEASSNFKSRPLTLTDIVWLFKRFPQLKSLSLAHVEILDPMVPKSQKGQQLKDLPTCLKSLRLNSSSNFWLDSLIEKDNVLEELRLKTRTNEFICLKPAKLPYLRVVSLSTSVPQLFNLIANSPDVSEIRLRGLQPDRKCGVRSYSLIPFMQLTQLKTLAIGYDERIHLTRENRSLEEDKELKYLSTDTDSLKFSNLRIFELSNAFIGPEIFGDILSKMPTIKCLKLRNIYVECHHHAPCLSCADEFVEYLPTLNLTELHLNSNRDNDCNECLMASLAQVISDERFPKLRKLKCCLKDLFSPFLYETFNNLAWKYPRESFAMTAPFDDQPNKAELLAVKPRNLEVIHSRCTSKDVYRSHSDEIITRCRFVVNH